MIESLNLPTAAEITLSETLTLLDEKFPTLSKAFGDGGYALWLGSGISRDRVLGLTGVLARIIEFLRSNATEADACPYRSALDQAINMANPSKDEREQIDLAAPASTWPCLNDLVARLVKQYSAVLSIEMPGKDRDHLLWDGADFTETFASQDADVEHLAVAILALEGAVSDVATANWDGLIEAAMSELGHTDGVFRITVTGEDLREPQGAQAILYKFHGCARRAIAEQETYRPLLIARNGQILQWSENNTFRIVRDKLGGMIQTSRSLIIGLSGQDSNIQRMFAHVGANVPWKWDDPVTPLVISADVLDNDQKTMLEGFYGADFDPNREAICDAATLRAYAKPLLVSLVLCVLTEKLKVLLSDVVAPALDDDARSALNAGLTHIRDRVAAAGEMDRSSLIRTLAATAARTRHQLQDGSSVDGVPAYFPIDTQSANLMKAKQALAASGQREASVALALIGLDMAEETWKATVDDPSLKTSGALRMSGATEARVFMAANDSAVGSLLEAGAFDEDSADVVVVCSRKVTDRQQRSPSASLRNGQPGPRYVSLGTILAEAPTLEDLRDRFRKEVSV